MLKRFQAKGLIVINLPYYGYSEYYQGWYTPGDYDEVMQFTIRQGKLICLVWGSKEERYDIVETIENFITEDEWLEKYAHQYKID